MQTARPQTLAPIRLGVVGGASAPVAWPGRSALDRRRAAVL